MTTTIRSISRTTDSAAHSHAASAYLRAQVQAAQGLLQMLVGVPAANEDVHVATENRVDAGLSRQRMLLLQKDHRNAARRARMEYNGVRAAHAHMPDGSGEDTRNSLQLQNPIHGLTRAMKAVRGQLQTLADAGVLTCDERRALHAQLTRLEAETTLLQFARTDPADAMLNNDAYGSF